MRASFKGSFRFVLKGSEVAIFSGKGRASILGNHYVKIW